MDEMSTSTLVWAGIFFCVSQSAMFSGLNLALLGISRLRLEVEATAGNKAAVRILALRKDVNFLLTTILWGNVGINVLLTLLSNSVMTGVVAFFFSTFLITFAGEIAPQAYFSRHAMRMGSLLAPVLRFYQFLLYPFAKPSAMVLDKWLGDEKISFFKERDLHTVIRKHIEAAESDVGLLEGIGAMNFLALDDIAATRAGEHVDPDSIIMLPIRNDLPVFPEFERKTDDTFLQDINHSGKKWIIIVGNARQPVAVLNANAFLRDALFTDGPVNPADYCHRPIVVNEPGILMGKLLARLKVMQTSEHDKVIDEDLMLVWGSEKRIITGADILGNLLHGIAQRNAGSGNEPPVTAGA
jgi:CBS domain containing-hemolysin-like protein